MLDLFLKLIDRFIDLAKSREEANVKRFALVKEMYEELEPVHADYLQMFEKVSAGLDRGDDIAVVARALQLERVVFEPARQKMLTVAEVLFKDENLGKYRDFFSAVYRYFSAVDPT